MFHATTTGKNWRPSFLNRDRNEEQPAEKQIHTPPAFLGDVPVLTQKKETQQAQDSSAQSEQIHTRPAFLNNLPAQMQAEEEEVQAKENAAQMQEEEEELQMKAAPAQGVKDEELMQGKAVQRKSPTQLKKNGTSPGMPSHVQAKMEGSFGTDFSNVNIHANDDSATQIGALAYTRGNDVHFAPGQYNPGSQKGQELLGHELTHVVQQRQGRVAPTKQGKGMPVNDSPTLEKEADNMGAKAARNEKNSITTSVSDVKSGITQAYRAASNKKTGDTYRLADDRSAIVKEGYPNHYLYAKPGKAATATSKLQAVGANIELEEKSESIKITHSKGAYSLKRVLPKNKKNNTEGDAMELWADCGRSNSEVVGSLSRNAMYNNSASKSAKTTETNPEMMKYEIFINHFKAQIANSATILSSIKTHDSNMGSADAKLEPYWDTIIIKVEALNNAIEKINILHSTIATFMTTYDAKDPAQKKQLDDYNKEMTKLRAAYQTEKKAFDTYLTSTKVPSSGKSLQHYYDIYFDEMKQKDDLVKKVMAPYEALSVNDKDAFDMKAGINHYANPEVGQGYTMSSGGNSYPGKSTWNFHWAGVVMESDDKKDKITLENYSVSDWDKENKKWDFAMYGTVDKTETFHHDHKDTKQHGDAPTTMGVEK